MKLTQAEYDEHLDKVGAAFEGWMQAVSEASGLDTWRIGALAVAYWTANATEAIFCDDPEPPPCTATDTCH